ncbi:hypothetical protein ACFL58_01300 [Elusimicrobiota bacterium]
MKAFKSLFIFIFAILLINPAAIFAHPASSIEMELDLQSRILDIEISHGVKDRKTHYIEKVEVYLNNELYITQTFKSQTNIMNQKLMYILMDAEAGDVIMVKTKCSSFGSKAQKIIIENTNY